MSINKTIKIVLDLVASVIVFGVTTVLATEIFSWILGTSKDASGQEKVHGGYAVTVAIFAISVTVSIVFARLFYRFLTKYKISKASEREA